MRAGILRAPLGLCRGAATSGVLLVARVARVRTPNAAAQAQGGFGLGLGLGFGLGLRWLGLAVRVGGTFAFGRRLLGRGTTTVGAAARATRGASIKT